jgi:F-type H+-transporting ATPase subunit alpha
MEVEDQVLIIFALTRGYLDDVEIKNLQRFEKEYLEYVHSVKPKIIDELVKTKDISESLEKKIISAIEDFKGTFNQEE